MLERNKHRQARLPSDHPPILTVIVDTEEEFDWSKPFSRSSVATTSISAQSLVHDQIYDKFGMVPTYVVDWPVATSSEAQTLRSLMVNGQCEIGTHLHPWVSPPHIEEVTRFNSYAGNLAPELEFQKLEALTRAITEKFGSQPKVFKAGRYGLGPQTSASIAKLGYLMDASVVPRTSFTVDGGPDYSDFDIHPYWFGAASQPLLELPVTAGFCGVLRDWGPALYPLLQSTLSKSMRLAGIASQTKMLDRVRLTPEGFELSDLIRLTKALTGAGCQVLTLTYHSPTIAAGNTPYVRDAGELKAFLATIENYLNFFKHELQGVFMSTSEIHTLLSSHHRAQVEAPNS